MLLGVLTVGAEGGGRAPVVRERVGGRGRVRLGGVVDGSRNGSATEELDGRNALGVSSSPENSGGSEHGCGCEGWGCWCLEDGDNGDLL